MEKTNIIFNNTEYSIDSEKMSTELNKFISHLGTIAGEGVKIVVNGVEYSVDSNKLSVAENNFATYLDTISGEAPEEEVLEGTGSEYYTLAPTALSFRSTEPLNEFQEVLVNGEVVDSSNYTLEEGSTIVKLSIDYLKTLAKGNYEVAVVSQNKTVKGDFTVAAPELNEYGFYYNQPYTAYMDYFSSDVIMFIREDNTMNIMVVANGAIETAEWTFTDGTLTITSPSMGELHCTFSTDGTELYNMELGATLSLNDNTKYICDSDYFYIYREILGGYEVAAIDKTKAEYSAIRTGINGIDTVKLGEDAFVEVIDNVQTNPNLIRIPEIPDTVNIIGHHAFRGCTALTSIAIPNNVVSIGNYAFDECINVTSLSIGNSVLSIGLCAFCDCDSIDSITIPNSVTKIDDRAFSCKGLTNIVYMGTISQWDAIDKHSNWNSHVPATYVQCSDGQVAL